MNGHKSGKKSDKIEQSGKSGKKLLSRIAGSFIFRILCSLVMAVVVWITMNSMYVNPPGEKTFNPPLSILHRSSLENLGSHGIELRTESFPGDVVVYLKGRQEDLDKLTRNDFEAYIDFDKVTGLEDSSLTVELRATNVENVTIVKIEPETVPIELEWRENKIFDVAVKFTGELEEGLYLSGYSRFPSTRSFTGREGQVNQISDVYVEVDLSGVSGNTVLHQQCRIADENGRELNRVWPEQVVDITLEVSKDVPVVANVTGSPAEDYYVRYITTTPETVRINGTKEALEQVDSLYTDNMDINNFRHSVAQERSILVPNNVRISANALPRAIIDVTIFKYLYTQDISLNKLRVEIINNDEQYRYEIVESEIPLLLKGKVDDITSLDSSQINAVIDVYGLTPGTHAVSTIVTLPEGIISVNDVLLTLIVAKNGS